MAGEQMSNAQFGAIMLALFALWVDQRHGETDALMGWTAFLSSCGAGLLTAMALR
jgi:hypothetical protein